MGTDLCSRLTSAQSNMAILLPSSTRFLSSTGKELCLIVLKQFAGADTARTSLLCERSGNQEAGSRRKEKQVWLNPTKSVLSQIYIQRQSCQLSKEELPADTPKGENKGKPSQTCPWTQEPSTGTARGTPGKLLTQKKERSEEGSVPYERTLCTPAVLKLTVPGWPRTQEIPL